MSLLERKNWPISLIFTILFRDIYAIILAFILGLFEEDAWYSKWYYWAAATMCLIFPIFIMFTVFEIQMLTKVSKKLNVPGSEIYATPYSWILCLIVPIVGWILLIVMYVYLNVWNIVMIYKGEGEKNIV